MRHSAPVPGRGNWIWLATAALTVVAVTGTAVSLGLFTGPGCAGRGHRARLAGGAAGLAAAAQPTAAGAPAAAPRARPGHALFYDPGTAAGSCSLGPFPASGRYAALPPGQYAGGAACGTYLEVRGPRGAVRAEVVDLCPSCNPATINLSRAAFDRIGDPSPGSAPVSYRRIPDPALPAPLVLRVADTGTPGRITIQVRNTGNALASVSLGVPATAGQAGRGWQPMTLRSNDYWVASGIRGRGPFALRIADALGHRVVLPRAELIPGTVVRTGTWFYRPRPPGRTAAPAAATSAARAAGC